MMEGEGRWYLDADAEREQGFGVLELAHHLPVVKVSELRAGEARARRVLGQLVNRGVDHLYVVVHEEEDTICEHTGFERAPLSDGSSSARGAAAWPPKETHN